MSGWFDSHCHLQDQYLEDAALADALSRARAAGVDRLVCIGTDAATSHEALRIARSADGVWATAGQHPHEASAGAAAVRELVAATRAAGDPALVAVGECGLDYHYEHSPRDAQRAVFAEQIALAHEHGLALVIHAREAWDDLFDVLAAEGVPARTVLHCFTGGTDEVRRCLDAGMYVSFSGIVTFKNASDVRDAARLCPLDRLLVETDAPFLAPVPHRGRPNEPAYVPLVGEAIAALRGLDPNDLEASTAAAAAAAFGI
jgi:TatD DNase family protein